MSEVEHFSWWVQHRRHIPTLSLDHFTGIDARSADAFASEGFGIVRVEAFAAEFGSVLEGLGVAIDADAAPALNRSPSLIEHTHYFDASAIDFVVETFSVDIAVGGYSFPS